MANRVNTPHYCEYCKKDFYPRKDKLKTGGGRFCSNKCVFEAIGKYNLSKPQSGDKNPNWKGGISKNNYHYKKLQVKRYPEKIRARELLYTAIKAGKINKGECEICGSNIDIHGHHEDYSEPLIVIWLCRRHHREKHNNLH